MIIAHLLYGHQLPRHQGATPPQSLITDELQGTAYTINSVEVIIAELQDTLCTVVVTSVVLINLHLQKVKGEQHQTKRSPLFILSYHSMEVVTVWWAGRHPQHGGDHCLQDLYTKETISYLQDPHTDWR